MKDIAGFGKIAQSILKALQSASGILYRPTAIRRDGMAAVDVEVYRIIRIAEAKARAKIIDEHTAQNALQVIDDYKHGRITTPIVSDQTSLRERTASRIVHVETMRQANIETVLNASLEQGEEADKSGEKARPIDDDWISAFIDYAQNISNEEILAIWARILSSQATEGRQPISRATLDALRLLEPSGARLFERTVRLQLLMGQIKNTDVVSELEFNIDGLEAMNLIDIGFLRRLESDERSLSLSNGILLFTKGGPATVKEATEPHFAEERLKLLRVDRCFLTSRGVELATILFPNFYVLQSQEGGVSETELGIKKRKARELILKEWALLYAERGVVPTLAKLAWKNASARRGQIHRASDLVPERYFDVRRKKWIAIPPE